MHAIGAAGLDVIGTKGRSGSYDPLGVASSAALIECLTV